MRRILILRPFVALALLFCVQFAQAQVTLILNTPPQLPERVNDWERLNALFSVTVTNTGATPLVRLRIAATVTNMDNNAVLFRTKNDLTRPFNAPPRIPQTLTAPQILPANSFEYDASVQTALIRTNTLPEGAYRLCVRVIDERGTTLGMEQCRTFNVVIPDPPSLISPVNGDSVRRMAPSIPIAPNFQWTQVFARFGQQSKYKLRVVPIFEGQQPRQALEGNPVLLEKIIQTSSYLWLPSDPRFDNYPNAKGFVWQVQAIDPNDVSIANVRAVGRNEGKSEIFTFGTPVPQSNVTSGEVLGPGSEITIGEFILKLGKDVNDVTKNTDGTITGKGTIAVNWLKQAVNLKQASFTINVEFKGITVENKKVTKGEVYATVTAPMKTFKEQLKDKANLPTVPDNVNISLGSDGSNLKQIEDNAKNALNNLLNGAISLPIGYQKDENSLTISIVGMKFTPVKAVINAMVRVPTPSFGEGAALALGAGCIPFTSTGPDPTKAMKLFLMEDFKVSQTYDLVFMAPVGDNDQNPNGTFAEFDKMSLKKFMIAGTVAFPTGWFTKVSDGTAVTGTFSGTSESLTAWVVSASIPDECLITKLPDFKLKIDQLSFDMSDKANPDGLTFPKNYGNGVAWRGFAIQKATITLPPYLKQFGSDKPLTLELSNFLIDGNGLSGTAKTAAKIEGMNFGGFKGTLETFTLSFLKMSPTEVGLGGTLTLPVGDATIGVEGTYAEGKGFSMAANLEKDTTFKIGSAAEFTLYGKNGTNSAKAVTISFDKTNGATASLSGTFTLSSGFGGNVQGTEMSFKGVAFEGVKLSPQGQKVFSLGYWSYVNGQNQEKSFGTIGKDVPSHLSDEALANFISDEVERHYAGGERLDLESAPMLAPGDGNEKEGLGGFPISIDSLSSSEDGNKTIINVGLTLNLDGKEKNSDLSGTTQLAISFRTKKGDNGAPMSFYDGDMDIKGIGVKGKIAGCAELNGTIKFFNSKENPTYGNGFYGAIEITLLETIKGNIATQFGRTAQAGRYWFIDANIVQKTGFPIGATGMSFYGFGGGVWKNMSVSGTGSFSSSGTDAMQVGVSFSGLKFTPSAKSNFGIKASCDIGLTANSTTFNGSVALLGEFEDGSLSTLALDTKAYFMTEILKRPADPKNQAMAYAELNISMDFPEKKFTCTGEYAINVTPTSNPKILTAKGSLDLLFSPDEWHIFLGTPQNPNTVSLFEVVDSKGYFMLGENLPSSTNFLAGAAKATSKRNEIQASNGDGIAFGMKQEINIPSSGEARFLMFYAKLKAGWGFEMMITKTNVQCQDIGRPGINGWYVDGQIGAWMSGEAGVYIDTWFYEGKAKFIGVNAAANLRAKFPNPSWLRGNVTIGSEVLDGLLSFETSFPFEFGSTCKPLENTTDLLKEFEPIGEIQPSDGNTDVSTFAVPTVTFNQNMEFNPANSTQKTSSNFDIPLPDGGIARFRFITRQGDIFLEKLDSTTGAFSYVSSKFSQGNNLKTASTLPENELFQYTLYRLTVRVVAEQFNFTTKSWDNVKFSDGKKAEFIKTITFKTGQGSLIIPSKTIASMNPMLIQRFYLQDENPEGRINFNQGLMYAFASKGNYVVRIKDADTFVGSETPITITNNSSNAATAISWKMPKLKNSTLYIMEVCLKSAPVNLSSINVNTKEQTKSLTTGNGYSVGTIKSLKSTLAGNGGVITNSPNDVVIGSYAFRTSKFNTFAEKIKTFRPQIQEGNAGNAISLAKNLCPSGYYTSSVGNLRYFTRVGNWPPANIGFNFPLSTYPYQMPPQSEFPNDEWNLYISAAKDLGELQQKASAGNTILQNNPGVLYSCQDTKSGPVNIYSLPYRFSIMKAISSFPAPHPLSYGTIANGINFNVEEPFDEIEVKNVDIGFRIEVQAPISGSGVKKKWDNSSIIYTNPAQPVNIFAKQKEAPKTAKIRIKSGGLDMPWLGDYTVQCFRASYSQKSEIPSITYRTVIGETRAFNGITSSKLCKELDSMLNDPTYWDFNEYEYTTPFYPLAKKEEPSGSTLQTLWLFASK